MSEESGINRENYDKFIDLASQLSDDNGREKFTFDLTALSRIVDIAYCEGQMAEIMIDEDWATDANKIARYGALQTQIENAFPEETEVEIIE